MKRNIILDSRPHGNKYSFQILWSFGVVLTPIKVDDVLCVSSHVDFFLKGKENPEQM